MKLPHGYRESHSYKVLRRLQESLIGFRWHAGCAPPQSCVVTSQLWYFLANLEVTVYLQGHLNSYYTASQILGCLTCEAVSTVWRVFHSYEVTSLVVRLPHKVWAAKHLSSCQTFARLKTHSWNGLTVLMLPHSCDASSQLWCNLTGPGPNGRPPLCP